MSSRLNYYFRQKVTEAELDLGFALLEDADQAAMTDLALTGIISGMVVTQRGAGANLTVDVSAGAARDKDGLRIAFTSTQNVNVAVDESAVTTTVVGVGNTKILSVFAKFARILSDPRTDGNSVTVYFSEAEGFAFVVRQGAEGVSPSPVGLDGSYLLLADITRAEGVTTIVNGVISTARREDCFVHAGSPNALRRGRIVDGLSDLTDWINTEVAARIAADVSGDADLAAHLADTIDAHDASAISYATSGYWADGATVLASTDVESAIDEIVADLAGTSGAAFVGATAVAGSYLFGTSGTDIQALIESIRGYLDLGPRGRYVNLYTSAIALSTDRQVNADTTGGAFTLTLPAPAHGIEFYVKDSAAAGSWGTNNLTLAPYGAEKIEGVAASRAFAADYGSFRVYSDGTDWFLG